MSDTIFALSSGSPPAAIAVVRVSGRDARGAAQAMIGHVPPPRRAVVRALRDCEGRLLDRALVLFFPGPRTATGEDLLELHCHGGRAVVAVVLESLARVPGLRLAQPGEFTRRALEHGIIDVAQAEGLADLLSAESEDMRIAALAASEGAVGRRLESWADQLATIRALLEAQIDYADEGDVSAAAPSQEWRTRLDALSADIAAVLSQPTVERLRDGALIVIAGPPNAGKSSLLNALCERDASIVTALPGTTRDVVEATVVRQGTAYRLADTAGLTEQTDDIVEQIGIARARELAAAATLVLWLGDPTCAPARSIAVHARADQPDRAVTPVGSIATSVHQPHSISDLWSRIDQRLREELHLSGVTLRARERASVVQCHRALLRAAELEDELQNAEELRHAATQLSRAQVRDANEAMLDELFARFCVGK